jgi:amidase
MDELLTRPALELARLLRDEEVTPRELTEAALRKLESRNGELGAFVHVDAERALADADAVDVHTGGPFAGVPTAIKDNRAVEGWPMRFGSRLAEDLVAPMDHALVRRLRAAGFVPIGKTTLPEFGILPTSEPNGAPPARNPWDTNRTPGGSSGGSAAAVAGGIVPVAHGNDGGGSTRIPAGCCGLVGLKAARGRVSVAPFEGDSFLVQDGMLTRTVADSAALLDVIAGYEPGDSTWAPPPPAPFAELAAQDPGRLRIAATAQPPIEGVTLEAPLEAAYREAIDALRALGHEVEEIDAPWAGQDVLQLFAACFGANIALSMLTLATVTGREVTRDVVEPLSWLMWEGAQSVNGAQFLGAMSQLQAYARGVVTALAPYDAVLTPGLATRPPEVGTMNGSLPDPEDTFRRSGQFTPYTAICNANGLPAIMLPFAHGDDGLPSPIQLMGRAAGEGALLALAAQLEAARPWAGRLAPGA